MKLFLKKIQTLLKALFFFALGFSILFLMYRHQDKAWKEQCALDGIPLDQCNLLDKLWVDFGNVHYGWLAMVGVFFMVSHLSRAIRWVMLVRPLGYKPRFLITFFSIGVAYFANLGFPRLGELVRAATLSRYERIPPEKVMGTVVVDRVADGLVLLLVLGLTLVFESGRILSLIGSLRKGSGGEGGALTLLIVMGVVGMTALVLMWAFRKRLRRLPILGKVIELLKGFGQGIQTIRHLEKPHLFILHSLNIWLMYYLMAYVGFFAFEPTESLGPMAALIVFAAGTLGITVPSPGGMGTYHFMVVAALSFFYGIQETDAFSFANIVFFAIQIGVTALFGIVSMILLPIVDQKKRPATESAVLE